MKSAIRKHGYPSIGGAKQVMEKSCSILTYVRNNNRELYDTIDDLCLVGVFSMKSFGPSAPKKELTFLMPVKGSEMHKEIISAAYGGKEHDAIAMIKNCLIWKYISTIAEFKTGDSLRTSNRTNVEVDTSGGFVKVGGAKIIPAENFVTLYTDARFHVYLLESGMLTATSGEVAYTASGGAWKELREAKETDSFMKTPAGLANSALYVHISSLQTASGVQKSMPGWMASKPNEVFYKWGVSLGKYLESHDPKGFALAKKTWTPNPMCVIPFCSVLLDRQVFNAWVQHEDINLEGKYTYNEYLTFVPKAPITRESIAAPVITSVVRAIQPSERKSMNEIATLIQKGYEAAYPKSGDIPWKAKMIYDEAVFVMNDYIAAAIDGDLAKCTRLSAIIVDHYTSEKNRPWLTDVKDSNFDIASNGALICKLVQFAISEAFMYPNEYCARRHRTAPLKETSESALQYAKLSAEGPECIDFTEHITAFFSKSG